MSPVVVKLPMALTATCPSYVSIVTIASTRSPFGTPHGFLLYEISLRKATGVKSHALVATTSGGLDTEYRLLQELRTIPVLVIRLSHRSLPLLARRHSRCRGVVCSAP